MKEQTYYRIEVKYPELGWRLLATANAYRPAISWKKNVKARGKKARVVKVVETRKVVSK